MTTAWGQAAYLFVISMLPVVELRGGIPVGAAMDLPWWECYLICVIGNMLPVPLLILFSRPVFRWLKRTFLRELVHKLESRIDVKSARVKRYRFWGLAVFVAIPLPGTGAWTGSFIASALNMRIRDAVLSVFLGVLVAGLVMTILSYGVAAVFG